MCRVSCAPCSDTGGCCPVAPVQQNNTCSWVEIKEPNMCGPCSLLVLAGKAQHVRPKVLAFDFSLRSTSRAPVLRLLVMPLLLLLVLLIPHYEQACSTALLQVSSCCYLLIATLTFIGIMWCWSDTSPISGHSNQPGGTGLIGGGRAMLPPLLLTAAAPLTLPRAALAQLPAVTCSCLNPALLRGCVSTHAVDVHSGTACCLVQRQCPRESCGGAAVFRLQTKSNTVLVWNFNKVSLCSQSSV
jgi:hypothetical protein